MYEAFFSDVYENEPDAAIKSAKAVCDYIASSTAGGKGIHSVHPLYIPKIIDRATLAHFKEIVSTTYGIFEKTIAAYRSDAAVRRIFGFSPLAEKLISADSGYACPLPMARFDFFYHEDDRSFTFCEINTDGTSAMNENRELNLSLQDHEVLHRFEKELATHHKHLEPFELFDSWVRCLGDIYKDFAATHPAAPKQPRVGIVDFLENAYMEDFTEFKKHFIRAGYDCEIIDIRSLSFTNGRLLDEQGLPVDAVYRRAVTSDILKHADEVRPFIDACLAGAFCPVGSFQTQIIHNKMLFICLFDDVLRAHFTKEECAFIDAHIPYSARLDKAHAATILSSKDDWILKPLDSYAAGGIYLGRHETETSWQTAVEEALATGEYLCQRFHLPYTTTNYRYDDKNDTLIKGDYHNMTGLYVYAGHLSGIYTRVCENEIIAGQYGGRELATVKICNTTDFPV